MICGLGVDVIELPRIARCVERFGAAFIKRILTPTEQDRAPQSLVPYLAARWAGKEAAAKALGTGIAQGVTFTDMEISNTDSGAPQLLFSGRAQQLCSRHCVRKVHISLTHGRETAVAVVILEQ